MRDIRVLIVEDEPPIGRFVKKLVEETEGFTVAQVCCTGEEGCEFLRPEPPDVLITDIRLPGMSGLELIRKAREYSREMFCIVISGYKMFEYAKEALEMEAAAYILKPIDPEELRRNLDAVREAWEKSYAETRKKKLQEAFRKKDEKAFQEIFPEGSMRLFAVYYGDRQEEICRIAVGVDRSIPWFFYKDWIFFAEGASREESCFEKIERKILGRAGRRNTCTCVMIPKLSGDTPMIGEIKKLCHEKLEPLSVPGRAIRMELGKDVEIPEKKISDERLLRQIRIAVQAQEERNVKKHFWELYALWEKEQAGIAHIRRAMHEIADTLKREGFLPADAAVWKEGIEESIRTGDSFAEIRDSVWKVIEELFRSNHVGEKYFRKDEEKLFRQICCLLEQNPEKNYSLQEICSRFSVSPPYVRKIFKRYTGKTYKEYQLEQKLELARQFLDQNPTMLVREVADRIGFEQLYFGTVFGKYMGMTPSQYKAKKLAERSGEADAVRKEQGDNAQAGIVSESDL
ncbi:MAG: response regulator [Eubacteriales bacterium]|nr:response regulator [Eubacteriales bacterium]